MKTWHGRIEAASSPEFETFTSSVRDDRRLLPYDLQVSRAHARALAAAEVISSEDAGMIVRALDEIEEEAARGEFEWRDDLEDVHTHVEVSLRERVGDLADALHAGRSRNDQVAADLRLYVRDQTSEALAQIDRLQRVLLNLADRHKADVMPGYTHLQQAQPIVIGHALLAYLAMLERDRGRFRDNLVRINVSPLGSGALAGATLPLNRQAVAEELGFEGVSTNSLDAVGDRDFAIEFVFSAALCLTHLSRLAEDTIIWASSEFGFLRLPDSFSSGSSMMPQKKNPDVPELIRGKSAEVLGDVVASLALMKGLALGYNRDLQEAKGPLFHAADTLSASLSAFAGFFEHAEFDTERTAEAVSSFSLATDLADYLVKQGIPFRRAHAITGRLVAECVATERELNDLTAGDLLAAAPEFAGLPQLTAEQSVRLKRTSGSTHPDEVAAEIESWHGRLEERARTGK